MTDETIKGGGEEEFKKATENDPEQGQDPIYPNNSEDEIEPDQGETGTGGVVSDIQKELSGEEERDKMGEGIAQPKESMPFDISNLSKEQLQLLKDRLNATPDAQVKVKSNPKVSLRRINGQLVTEIKDAVPRLVDNEVLQKKETINFIPVKYYDGKWDEVVLKDYLHADREWFEVISTREHKEQIIEGETVSRETGMLVEVINTKTHKWFTLKIDENTTIEISSEVANS